MMGQTVHHYLIFETAGGFCGIAWNDVGITRFQLPTRSADATERMLLRRAPGAEPGAPTPEVAEAVAAVKRYFAGEETDFSGFNLDLGDQDAFFKEIYAAARRVGWGRTTTYGALAKELGAGPEAARDVGQAMATESGGADHPLPPGAGGRRQGRWISLRRAARRPRSACSSWRAFASSHRSQLSGLLDSEPAIWGSGVSPPHVLEAQERGFIFRAATEHLLMAHRRLVGTAK